MERLWCSTEMDEIALWKDASRRTFNDSEAYAWAYARVSWARRELERFEQTVDEEDSRTPRTRRKLQGDLEGAERDLRWAENALLTGIF